jgi:hypothetical protein
MRLLLSINFKTSVIVADIFKAANSLISLSLVDTVCLPCKCVNFSVLILRIQCLLLSLKSTVRKFQVTGIYRVIGSHIF